MVHFSLHRWSLSDTGSEQRSSLRSLEVAALPSAPKSEAQFRGFPVSLLVHRQGQGPAGRRVNRDGRRELQSGIRGECRIFRSGRFRGSSQRGLPRAPRLPGARPHGLGSGLHQEQWLRWTLAFGGLSHTELECDLLSSGHGFLPHAVRAGGGDPVQTRPRAAGDHPPDLVGEAAGEPGGEPEGWPPPSSVSLGVGFPPPHRPVRFKAKRPRQGVQPAAHGLQMRPSTKP